MIGFYNKSCERFYEKYPRIYEWFTASQKRVSGLKIFKSLSTAVMYAAYILLLVFLGATGDIRIIKAVVVPAFVFLFVTVARKGINAPRPYERYSIKPVIPKSTKGKSCPSRHTACAFIIALAVLYVNVPLGICLLILSVFIGISRPVMGVHFPLDVTFAAVIAIVLGIIGFFVIP